MAPVGIVLPSSIARLPRKGPALLSGPHPSPLRPHSDVGDQSGEAGAGHQPLRRALCSGWLLRQPSLQVSQQMYQSSELGKLTAMPQIPFESLLVATGEH